MSLVEEAELVSAVQRPTLNIARSGSSGMTANTIGWRSEWIEIALFDEDGAPVIGEPVEILCARDHSVIIVQGVANGAGSAYFAFLDDPGAERDVGGHFQVSARFPALDLAELAVDRIRIDREPGPILFDVGKTWLEVVLVDEDGAPVADAEWRALLPGEHEPRTGVTNRHGQARFLWIENGPCKFSFVKLDRCEVAPEV